jgi:glucose/arabinose dehydrogenase
VKVVDLPAGTINHHWTKNVIASLDGSRLYVTVGSNSNAAENGIDKEVNRAAILEVDPASGRSRLFASGLRNPNGLDWQPQSGALWVAVNERDELGSDLVPDFMTSVQDGAFYGWPYSYYGQYVDVRVEFPSVPTWSLAPLRPTMRSAPIPRHSGQYSIATIFAAALSAGGAFIGQHGSWNRTPRSGYKVIFVAFDQGRPVAVPEDVLTGFVNDEGDAYGRPVGVAVDRGGALLVADDVGNVVWRVTPAASKP